MYSLSLKLRLQPADFVICEDDDDDDDDHNNNNNNIFMKFEDRCATIR